jgi:hypothetical protein
MQQYDLATDANAAAGQHFLAQAREPTATEPKQPTAKASGLPTIPETSRLTCLISWYLTVIACSGLLLLLCFLASAVGVPQPAISFLGRAAEILGGHPVIIAWFLANQITSHFGHIVGQTDDAWNRVFWFAFTPYLATLLAIACLKARARMWGEAFMFCGMASNYWAIGLIICMAETPWPTP